MGVQYPGMVTGMFHGCVGIGLSTDGIEFLGNLKTGEGQAATRLDLANWLVDPKEGIGGLTARVFANRCRDGNAEGLP